MRTNRCVWILYRTVLGKRCAGPGKYIPIHRHREDALNPAAGSLIPTASTISDPSKKIGLDGRPHLDLKSHRSPDQRSIRCLKMTPREGRHPAERRPLPTR